MFVAFVVLGLTSLMLPGGHIEDGGRGVVGAILEWCLVTVVTAVLSYRFHYCIL